MNEIKSIIASFIKFCEPNLRILELHNFLQHNTTSSIETTFRNAEYLMQGLATAKNNDDDLNPGHT